jgi:hypothetical protein
VDNEGDGAAQFAPAQQKTLDYISSCFVGFPKQGYSGKNNQQARFAWLGPGSAAKSKG